MIDAVHNLDSFRTIVEYREEVCQELSKELEEAIGALNDHKMDAMLLDPSQMVDASRGDKEVGLQTYNRIEPTWPQRETRVVTSAMQETSTVE